MGATVKYEMNKKGLSSEGGDRIKGSRTKWTIHSIFIKDNCLKWSKGEWQVERKQIVMSKLERSIEEKS